MAAGSEPASHSPVPVELAGKRVIQVDPYSCGALTLLMLEATGDPDLAVRLDTEPGLVDQLQRDYRQRGQKRGIGPFPWPAALGIPPWTLAREARFPGVTYRPVPVDDATVKGRNVLAAVWNATRAGIPVPLYTGGNMSGGLARAVPRHVILAVPHGNEASLRLFDPGSGALYTVPLADLAGRTTPHPALGNWTHIVWALLPLPLS